MKLSTKKCDASTLDKTFLGLYNVSPGIMMDCFTNIEWGIVKLDYDQPTLDKFKSYILFVCLCSIFPWFVFLNGKFVFDSSLCDIVIVHTAKENGNINYWRRNGALWCWKWDIVTPQKKSNTGVGFIIREKIATDAN